MPVVQWQTAYCTFFKAFHFQIADGSIDIVLGEFGFRQEIFELAG
jgi:hypothetical protein